jgi:hypothetical protein
VASGPTTVTPPAFMNPAAHVLAPSSVSVAAPPICPFCRSVRAPTDTSAFTSARPCWMMARSGGPGTWPQLHREASFHGPFDWSHVQSTSGGV